jgi:hypothetical protein
VRIDNKKIIFPIYLSPYIPLSFKGEGEEVLRETSPLFDSLKLNPFQGYKFIIKLSYFV